MVKGGHSRLPVWLVAGAVMFLVLGLFASGPAQALGGPSRGLSQGAQAQTKIGAHYTAAGCNTAEKNYLQRDFARCFALVRTNLEHQIKANPNDPPSTALGPADIQDAYNLPAGGSGMTVAVVDAFGYNNAESDLAAFRSYYGLPACTTDNGCFSKLDQNGGTNYPPDDPGWALESALDVDAVSSACPACNIMLIEGNDNSLDNLGIAASEAVTLGADAVSNSYGVPGEDPSETAYDHYYNHPGVAVTASTGDTGDVTNWPATNPNVVAIGGTTLTQDSSPRGWHETAWNEGGSGCSPYEAKPDYQQGINTNCNNRAIADVSADADPATGLAVYDTDGYSGWLQVGGTSLSSPLLASMYAMAGPAVPNTYPVTYPYNDPGQSNDLFDVTEGTNGSCGNVLCQAGPGWDGPTGLGTPNGLGALTSGPHGDIVGTVKAKGDGPLSGATVTATDEATGNTYNATTDDSGQYDLTAPAGTYDVTASLFGYRSKTVTGVVVTQDESVTENFALPAVVSHTLTGTVTDGSGHGWPMYAKITIDGYPGSGIYTNPYTGRYSVDLPARTSYTLHVSAVEMPGYQEKDVTVRIGTADKHKNVKLEVDQSTCSTPGYAYQYNGTGTDFEGWTDHAPQDGWSVTDNAGTGITWEFDDPGNRGNMTGGSGNFAIVDSDHYGPGTSEDTSLVSPVVDMSNQTNPEIGFDTDYFSYFNSTADVDLSLDGGQTWSNVWERTTTSATGHVDVEIPQAAGQSQVEVRFHYIGSWAFWWELDNVFIGNRVCAPTHGGLVAGIVTDDNTGDPINGAKVSSDVEPSAFGVSHATPDDPNLSDGFYWLFDSQTGSQPFTASDGKYTADHGNVDVPADYVQQANWVLKAGHLAVQPGNISVTERMGQSKSATVQFSNDGSSSVHVKLSEQDGGFNPMHGMSGNGAPVQQIKGHFSSKALVTAKRAAHPATVQLNHQTVQLRENKPFDAPWQDIADYPTPTMDNATGYDNGLLYSFDGYNGVANVASGYVYDPTSQAWTQIADSPEALEKPAGAFIGGKFYMVGGWNASGNTVASTYIYDPSTDSWSQGADMPKALTAPGVAVVNGELWVVGGCTTGGCVPVSTSVYSYDPGSDSWTQHADYPLDESWQACGNAGGQLVCAGGIDSNNGTTTATYVYDASSDSWSQAADMPADDWAGQYTSANGQLLVQGGVINSGFAVTNQAWAFDGSSWTALPNSNDSVYRGGGACGFYSVGGSTGGFAPTAASEVLPGYDQCGGGADVPWLSENKTEFDVAPGQTVSVEVTMDSSGVSQPGDYMANLSVSTDSPYSIPPIAVTMHVNPPTSWGKIAGTVTDAGSGNPIPGATVQLCTMYDGTTGQCGPVTYTLKTDADGYYQVWLNKGYNPVEVIAAKDGYQPAVKIARIHRGDTTTVNFALNKS